MRVSESNALPSHIQTHPALAWWVSIDDHGKITIATGKVEIGQGIKTAIAMIAAEELDVAIQRIEVRTAHSALTPDESITAGSLSVEDSGAAVRVAAASARQILLEKAVEALKVPLESLRVEDGVISSPNTNRITDYWQLHAGRPFDHCIERMPSLKPPDQYQLVGRSVNRLDLEAKLRGTPAFIQDMRPPDLVHARVVRPPVPGSVLKHLDPSSVELPAHLRLVRNGSFVGIITTREEHAVDAAARLARHCHWTSPRLASDVNIASDLRQSVMSTLAVVDGTAVETLPPISDPVTDNTPTLTATYTRPFQMHASLGPSAAIARYDNGQLTLFTHSQWIGALKLSLAQVLPLSAADITIIHAENAGCYGHNGADDAALDAALLAMALPERSVMLKWAREDEHRYEPYAPAMLVDMRARVDRHGRIIDWGHAIFSYSHNGRPDASRTPAGESKLLSAQFLDPPLPIPDRRPNMGTHSGSHRNADPLYQFPNKSIVKHFCGAGPLRCSSLRSLGAFTNVFAIESFIDELARHVGEDPINFRLAHLQDPRARAVLARLRELIPAKSTQDHHGRGLAFSQYKNRQTYAAVAVDVRVEGDGSVELIEAWIVADAGLVIDPDGLRNQLEGGFIQSASWTLKEQVSFDETGIHSIDWHTYPILDFTEIPHITTTLMDYPNEAPLGAGEATTGPTPAAIANAIDDAVGLRLRDIPFTPDRVRENALR